MGSYFEDIHSMPINEIDGVPHGLTDTPEVAALRRVTGYSGCMALGKALCRQLRYREAIEAYSEAIALMPNETEAYRQRAARYITTLQGKKAAEDLKKCLALCFDRADVEYRLGIAYYLAGEYASAMEVEESAFHCFDDEMGIAAMFWHTLSAYKLHVEPTLLREYRDTMQVGHHTAYQLAMRTAAGLISLDGALELLAHEESDLEYAMAAYGTAVYAGSIGEEEISRRLLGNVVARDGFWICYGYLAAWNDTHK